METDWHQTASPRVPSSVCLPVAPIGASAAQGGLHRVHSPRLHFSRQGAYDSGVSFGGVIMVSLRALLCAGVLLTVFPVTGLKAQKQANHSGVPTIRVKSSLVFLDVTVLDKKGRPVVKGLTKDDFTIFQDDKPQRIFSFESPDVHVMGVKPEEQNPEGKAPVTIFVLDRLNSSIEEFDYIRNTVRRYLARQPK